MRFFLSHIRDNRGCDLWVRYVNNTHVYARAPLPLAILKQRDSQLLDVVCQQMTSITLV